MPGTLEATVERAVTAMGQGNYELAVSLLAEAERADPDNPDLSLLRGEANRYLGRNRDWLLCAQKAIALRGSASDWLSCAEAYAGIGDDERALGAYEACMAANPQDAERGRAITGMHLTRVILHREGADQMVAAVRDHAASMPGDPDAEGELVRAVSAALCADCLLPDESGDYVVKGEQGMALARTHLSALDAVMLHGDAYAKAERLKGAVEEAGKSDYSILEGLKSAPGAIVRFFVHLFAGAIVAFVAYTVFGLIFPGGSAGTTASMVVLVAALGISAFLAFNEVKGRAASNDYRVPGDIVNRAMDR